MTKERLYLFDTTLRNLPPPSWGRAGEGGNPDASRSMVPPPPIPPHRGEGSSAAFLTERRS